MVELNPQTIPEPENPETATDSDLSVDFSPSTIRMATTETAAANQDAQQAAAYADQQAETQRVEAAALQDALKEAEQIALEHQFQEQHKLTRLARGFFVAALALGILMVSYFYFWQGNNGGFTDQLSVAAAQENRERLEAGYNIRIYQLIDTAYQDLVWHSLEFLAYQQASQSSLVDTVEQAQAAEQAVVARAAVDEKLNQLNGLMQKLSFLGSADARDYRVALLDEVPTDVENPNVKFHIRNKMLHDLFSEPDQLLKVRNLEDDLFAAWLTEFLNAGGTPETKLVSLYANRLLWSEIINAIATITQQIDPDFGSTDQFVTYSAYNFNSRTKQLTVTGQIRTEDSQTFTRIANLIDSLVAYTTDQGVNPFRNVKTRSFSKNQQQDNDSPQDFFQATVRLDFELADLKPEIPHFTDSLESANDLLTE